MPNRAQRRAQKFAAAPSLLSGNPQPSEAQPVVAPSSDQSPVISVAQLNANRANAQKSSGPVTEAGKAKVSLNALKTGLTGQTVLLPSDDVQAYQAHVDRHFTRYAPINEEEHTLVQFLADTEWRLLRIAPLESALWAKGRRELAGLHADEPDPAVRESLIKLAIAETYRKEFNNLALQERRLRNHYKADHERLKALIDGRRRKEMDDIKMMNYAAMLIDSFQRANQPFDPKLFGFEFSLEEIEYYLAENERLVAIAKTAPHVKNVLAAFHQAKKASQAA